jgi:serine-type D-Ala-D-Ala carboxypeptidase/endopeptidase (penicillin-binding protein 4)
VTPARPAAPPPGASGRASVAPAGRPSPPDRHVGDRDPNQIRRADRAAAATRAAEAPDGDANEARPTTGRPTTTPPSSGGSERPGAVGRASVAPISGRNPAASQTSANAAARDAAARDVAARDAAARESAGLAAAQLAARVAAETQARELAERAAHAQRAAQEQAARDWRERALAEQRARDAARAAARDEESRTRPVRDDSHARAQDTIRISDVKPPGTQTDRPVRTDVDEGSTHSAGAGSARTNASVDTTDDAPAGTAAADLGGRPPDRRTPVTSSGHRRRRRVAAVTGAVVAVIVIAIVATIAIVKTNSYSAAPAIAPAPKIDSPGPVLAGFGSSAPVPTAAGLTAALAHPLADKRLGAHVSVAVRDVATGRLLYGHGASSPTTPASSMKLATATALLALRGPNYRITTRVVAGAKPGEVVLVGAGDPTLAAGPKSTYPESGRLDVLADEVKRALGGVKPTRVVIDTTLFSGPATSTGWKTSDANSTYVHPIYALATDGGRIDPTKTGNSDRYPNSALAAGQIFAKYLGLPATAVMGGRAPKATTASSPTSPGAFLASVQSAPLERILDTMLTDSDNVLAEFMARQVAIAAHRPASFAGAATAVTGELAKLGLPIAGTRIVDGSGVSHLNRLTPALLTALLSYDAQPSHSQFHAVFSGLPIAGWSGTLAGRFTAAATKPAAGVLRAKTGTLDGVSALAGTVVDASGRSLAFAVMVDKVPIGLDAPAAEDAIGAALYRCGCGG